VYIAVRRNFLDPFMQAFDQPVPATTCGKRHTSNVPAQALALLNSELAHELAAFWGKRLAAQADVADDARIESMWIAAFARAPRAEERAAASEFLRAERAAVQGDADRDAATYAALAHTLFSTKEFVFLR
jgi:hypothetical protein